MAIYLETFSRMPSIRKQGLFIMFNYLFCLFFLLFSTPATALEIAGVTLPDTLNTDLQLNGAGIRSKFF